MRYGEDENQATHASFSGQIEQALVIGLLPDTWYYVSVQVYNDAGNGQKSEKYPQKTFRRGKTVKYLQILCSKSKNNKAYQLKMFRRGKIVIKVLTDTGQTGSHRTLRRDEKYPLKYSEG